MNLAAWRSVIWKEWREQRAVLIALLAVAVGLHAWALAPQEQGRSHYAQPLLAVVFLVAPLGAVLAALNIAAGERSRGTSEFLRSAPLPPAVIAGVKLGMALAVLTFVLCGCVLLTEALFRFVDWRGVGSIKSSIQAIGFSEARLPWQLGSLLFAIPGVASLVIWFAALGVNRESEVRAASIGVSVTAGVWSLYLYGSAVTSFAWQPPEASLPSAYWLALTAAMPGGSLVPGANPASVSGPTRVVALGAFLLTHVPLLGWYVWRFGRVGATRPDSRREHSRDSHATWLGSPRRSPAHALVWKQARQTQGIAIAGLVAATLLSGAITALTAIEAFRTETARPPTGMDVFILLQLTKTVYAAFLTLGCCVALVSGVGTITSDLSTGLATFWRSRPINADQWFAVAFGVGLGGLLAGFWIPAVVSIWVHDAYTRVAEEHLTGAPVLLLLCSMYIAGVLAGAVVRHAVYACLLGFCLFLCLQWVFFCPWARGLPDAVHATLSLATLTAVTLLAWQAVRRDWAVLRS